MTLWERLGEAWRCETCRKYRQGVLVVLLLLAATWLLS